MTAQEAAQVASQSNSQRLILTHLSQRYKTPDEILDEATTVFRESEVAYDLMKVKL